MIERRITLFIIIFLLATLVLIKKLYEIQIKNHQIFTNIASKLTEEEVTKKPLRGELYDRNNILLASSIQLYKLYLDKRMLPEKDYDTLAILSRFTGVPFQTYIDVIKSSDRKQVLLHDALDAETYQKLNTLFLQNRLSCFRFEEYQKRIYSHEGLAAHVIGYVQNDSEGIDGIEKYYNDFLRGREGKVYYRKDAAGRLQGIISDKGNEPQEGYNLQLTIDLEIQKILEEELDKVVRNSAANYGVGIIMNPNTGEILALANSPSFEPSKYFAFSDEIRRNKAISDVYDPGSTFKAVTLASAIDLGKINLDQLIYAENGIYKVYNGKTIRDDHKFSFLTPEEAFIYSSNIAMAKISENIGEELFYKYVYNFGFGNYTSIDLPGEVRGIVSKPQKNNYNLLWMAHGYSISVTPIQLISMYAAIINGGKLLKPFVVRKVFDVNGNIILENKPTVLRTVISESTSAKMRSIMQKVILEGTGKKAQLDGITCGGKTGTAKKFLQGIGYSGDTYIASFVGFFPLENPEFLVFIKIDSPKNGYYGGEIAAPVFKNIGNRIWSNKQLLKKIQSVFVENSTQRRELEQFPDLTGKSKLSAIEIAKSFGSKIEIRGKGDIVQNQIYDSYHNKVIFILKTNGETVDTRNKPRIEVPNIVGLSLRDASARLKQKGIRYIVEGTGYVVDQSIKPGNLISKDDVLRIKCQVDI